MTQPMEEKTDSAFFQGVWVGVDVFGFLNQALGSDISTTEASIEVNLTHWNSLEWPNNVISLQCSRKQEVSYRVRTANTGLSCNRTCVGAIYLGVRRAVQYIGVTLQAYLANDSRCRPQP